MAHSAIRGTSKGDYDYRRPGGCDWTYDLANPAPFPSPKTEGRWGRSGPPVLDDWSDYFAEDALRRLGRAKGKEVVSSGGGSTSSNPYFSAE